MVFAWHRFDVVGDSVMPGESNKNTSLFGDFSAFDSRGI